MARINCWEYKRCGREPRGANVDELGICPASLETRVDGINSGINGGRVCWAIAGTFCMGKVQGTFALKVDTCLDCDFYHLVKKEERLDYKKTSEIIDKLI